VRQRLVRVQAQSERLAHRLVQQPIHYRFRAGQPRGPIVSQQKRLADELQISIHDCDPQSRDRRSIGGRNFAALDGERLAFALRRRR